MVIRQPPPTTPSTPIGLSEGCDLEQVKLGTLLENQEMRGVLENVFGCIGDQRQVKNAVDKGLKIGSKEVIYTINKTDWEQGGMERNVRTWLEGRWKKDGVAF